MEEGKKGQNRPRRRNKEREQMKVKYISSPVMVNAKNAAEFRSIVQELTRKSPESGSRTVVGGSGNDGGGGGWPSDNIDAVECSSIKAPMHEIDNINDDYFWKEFSQSLSVFQYPDY